MPRQVIAGTSTATVLYHAGQGIRKAASAAVRGDPAAIATRATHIANAIFSAVSVNAAWNGLPFSNQKGIADELVYWTTTPLKESMNGTKKIVKIEE